MVKVSVIIPVYNVEKYLRKCLDSVLGQTLEDIEVIAVDDGSKDSSGAILDEYAKKDARLIVIHQKNGGVSSARNTALDITKGEFVGFVDADDWVDDNFYETLYNTAQEKQADVVKGNLYLAHEDGSLKVDDLNKKISVNQKQHIATNFTYAFCTAIYKNSVIKENKIYYKNASRAEDVEWLFRVLCKTQKYAQCDDVYYYYNQNDNSTTHNVTLRQLNDLYEMTVSIYKTAEKANFDNSIMLNIHKMCLRHFAYIFDNGIKGNYDYEYNDLLKKFIRLRKYHCVIKFYVFGLKILSIEEAE